jgi:endoglucanase
MQEVWDWNTGFFCYMKANNRSSNVESWYKTKFTSWVNNKVDRYKNSPWGNVIMNGNYYWGSNNIIIDIPMECLIGSEILKINTNDIKNMALSGLNYILGANPLRKSFLSYVGDDSVKNVYGTFSEDGLTGAPKGFMPLGANKYEGKGLSIFAAKCFIDSTANWTTNEHSLGSTSSLVFITAFANSSTTTGLKGDVNGNGTVDIIDGLLIAQYYVGLNPAGFVAANADVNCSGTIDIIDALLVAQYYVGLVSSFPC